MGEIKGATPLNNLADQQVKAAVDAELAKKGLTKSESDTADLYVGYQGPSDKKRSTRRSIPAGAMDPAGTAAAGTAAAAG